MAAYYPKNTYSAVQSWEHHGMGVFLFFQQYPNFWRKAQWGYVLYLDILHNYPSTIQTILVPEKENKAVYKLIA